MLRVTNAHRVQKASAVPLHVTPRSLAAWHNFTREAERAGATTAHTQPLGNNQPLQLLHTECRTPRLLEATPVVA
jgi:hypothetical protein